MLTDQERQEMVHDRVISHIDIVMWAIAYGAINNDVIEIAQALTTSWINPKIPTFLKALANWDMDVLDPNGDQDLFDLLDEFLKGV